MTLNDVEDLANKNDGCVSFLPVVVESSIAKGVKEEIGVAEAIVGD